MSRLPLMPRRGALRLLPLLPLAACGAPRYLNAGGQEKGRGQVILLRGFMNLFSTGMDALGDRIAAAGYAAEVHSHISWRQVASRCLREGGAGGPARPFAVIGHSLGADAAIEVARAAGRAGLATDLLVTFDTAWAGAVPQGPRKVLNFHTMLDPPARALVPAPGFDGTIENVPLGPETHLTHFSLDDSPVLHARVLAALEAVAADRAAAVSPCPTRGAPFPA